MKFDGNFWSLIRLVKQNCRQNCRTDASKNFQVSLQENGLDIKVTDEAKAELLKAGKDTRYGARPLRRALRKLVEDPVSDFVSGFRIKRGDTIFDPY